MLSTTEIDCSLTFLEQAHQNARDNREAIFISKFAILEVCGWIEQAMDKLALDCASRCSISPPRMTHYENQIVKKINSFSYTSHFEKLITAIVGYRVLELAENNSSAEISILKNVLEELKRYRDHYAHTHFDINNPYPQNVSTIPAPSILKSKLRNVHDGLNKIQAELINQHC